jgi:hypothetical protein
VNYDNHMLLLPTLRLLYSITSQAYHRPSLRQSRHGAPTNTVSRSSRSVVQRLKPQLPARHELHRQPRGAEAHLSHLLLVRGRRPDVVSCEWFCGAGSLIVPG